MANQDTFVVLTEVKNSSRKALEMIECMEYKTLEDAKKDVLSENVGEGFDSPTIQIIPITDFMDMWNNSDSDKTILHIDKVWFGYIKIDREKK